MDTKHTPRIVVDAPSIACIRGKLQHVNWQLAQLGTTVYHIMLFEGITKISNEIGGTISSL